MVQFFLKIKHWQLFLLTIGIPLIAQMTLMYSMFNEIFNNNEPELYSFDHLIYLLVVILLGTGIFFAWMWAISFGLRPKIPQELLFKSTVFKIAFFILIAYIVVISLFVGVLMSSISSNEPDSMPISPFALLVLFPLNLLAVLCMFYCMYFSAKTIKTAELQKPVTLSDFAVEFVLFWFYIVGIWILQPRINKLFQS